MTAAERRSHESLIKKRVKVEKQKAQAHGKQLIANADDEMSRRFKLEDLGIKEVADQVAAEVEKLKAQMNARLDAMGVQESLRPDINLIMNPGGYRNREHRQELRREARVNVDAAVERRLAEIDAWELEALTELARSGIESDQAAALLDRLPPVAESLPSIDGLLGPVETQPLGVLSTARDQKRQAILGAIGQDPQASNREIGRLIGVDHKTVSKVRESAGEVPGESGEIPTADEEIPTGGDDR